MSLDEQPAASVLVDEACRRADAARHRLCDERPGDRGRTSVGAHLSPLGKRSVAPETTAQRVTGYESGTAAVT